MGRIMKKISMGVILSVLLLGLSLVAACNSYGHTDENGHFRLSGEIDIADSRLNGDWRYIQFGNRTSIGVFDWYSYSSYNFYGTNRMRNYISREEYGIEKKGYPLTFDYEIEIDEVCSKIRRRLWKNNLDNWDEWLPYEILENGDLKIGDRIYEKAEPVGSSPQTHWKTQRL